MTEPVCGVLYLCSTPIGNLEDITLRVLRILKEVDLIAAEDTRHTRKLLSHYDIHTALTSYHEHNHHSKGNYLLEQVANGKKVALVSDAGTPGISDPGEELVAAALEKRLPVVPVPGSSAVLAAVIVSGLPAGRFVFEGFLPKKNKEREARLAALAAESRTTVIYESPHRLRKTLDDLLESLGDRPACAARELTKRYEEVIRGTISQLREYFFQYVPRGEFVLVIGGASGDSLEKGAADRLTLTAEEHVQKLIGEGMRPVDAIKAVARLRNIPRRALYDRVNKKSAQS